MLIRIWLDRLHDLLQQGHVLVLGHLPVEATLFLQLAIVLGHELLHLAHHVVVPLVLDRLLIVLQLPREQVRLGVLELNRVELILLLVYLVWDVARGFRSLYDPPILYLVCIDEPDIVTVVLHELRRHLQELDLTHFLKEKAHFQALHVGVTLELSGLEQLKLVDPAKLIKTDLLRCRLIVSRVQRRPEPHSYVVVLRALAGEDPSLHIIDDFGVTVLTVHFGQFLSVVSKLVECYGSCRLFNLARVDLLEARRLAIGLLGRPVVPLVVVAADPGVPRLRRMLILILLLWMVLRLLHLKLLLLLLSRCPCLVLLHLILGEARSCLPSCWRIGRGPLRRVTQTRRREPRRRTGRHSITLVTAPRSRLEEAIRAGHCLGLSYLLLAQDLLVHKPVLLGLGLTLLDDLVELGEQVVFWRQLRLLIFVAIEFGQAKIFIVLCDELGVTLLIEHGIGKEDFTAGDILLLDVLPRPRHQLLDQYVEGHVIPSPEILLLLRVSFLATKFGLVLDHLGLAGVATDFVSIVIGSREASIVERQTCVCPASTSRGRPLGLNLTA